MAAILLLADGSTTIQRVVELTFADEDVRVIVAGDGDAAILCIENEPPDIVLADVGTPGRNGYEVASYVKHAPHLSHIPVLLLTGAFEPVDQLKADEAGCDGVLTKPLEPRLIIGRVKELLQRSRDLPSPTRARPLPVASPGTAVPSPTDAADGSSAASESLGDFFDKLDAAFANLPIAKREAAASEASPPPAPPDTVDHPAAARPVVRPPNTRAGRAATGPMPPAPDEQAIPPLAEAFADLLAAEQAGGSPANAVTWARPPIAMDDLVERVAHRVLERLSDRVVRETTAEIVSSIAERLVREEIERIKAAIKNM